MLLAILVFVHITKTSKAQAQTLGAPQKVIFYKQMKDLKNSFFDTYSVSKISINTTQDKNTILSSPHSFRSSFLLVHYPVILQ